MESRVCEALSRVSFKRGEGAPAKLEWLLKALESIERCDQLDPRFIQYAPRPTSEQEMIDNQKYNIHLRLGMTYLDNSYLLESLPHLKAAEKHFKEKQNYKMCSNAAYSLGSAYLSLESYDSCLVYLNKGYEASEMLGDKELCIYFHYAMSLYYSFQNERQHYEDDGEKIQLLRQSIAECEQGLAKYEEPLFRYKDGFYSQMAKAYFELEQYDSCIYYSEQQLLQYEKIHFEIVPNRWYSNIFWLLYKSYDAVGEKEKALENANRYWELKKQMDGDSQELEKVKSDYERMLERQRLQMEQQTERYRLYLLLAGSLVLLILILWMAFRYRKNKEIESLKYQEAYHEIQTRLEATTHQSQQALQQRAMNLYKTHPDHMLEQLVTEFESFYPQASQKLKEAYPELNETERNLVMLSFMGFRMKEEAEILNLSENTVGKYRSNIRKKAGIHPFPDLFR